MDKHYGSVRYSANTEQRTFPTAIFYLLFLLSTEFYLTLHCVVDTVLFKNKQKPTKKKFLASSPLCIQVCKKYGELFSQHLLTQICFPV